MKRAFSLIEIVIVIGIAGLLGSVGRRSADLRHSLRPPTSGGYPGSVALPRIGPTLELFRYRFAMQEIAAEIRVVRFRAINEQRTFLIDIDPSGRRLQVVVVEDQPVHREWVERTIWLPEGIDFIDAPERLTVLPSGRVGPATVLAEAARFNRIFRLTIGANGVVRLTEESST